MEIIKIDINKIKEYENNAKDHPEWQITQICKSIQEFGFNDPIAVNGDFQIIEGHGRYLACKKLGIEEIPCIILKNLTEAQERAYIIAHNKLTINTGFDFEKLEYELNALKIDGFDLELTGFDKNEFVKIFDLGEETEEENVEVETPYTTKIETPVYTPKGIKPNIKELVDVKKYTSLIEEIEKSDISDEEKSFLKMAATRHIVFDYENIAEYYSHSDKGTKELFENSALVIIDFNKAIEQGYVNLTKETLESLGVEYEEE